MVNRPCTGWMGPDRDTPFDINVGICPFEGRYDLHGGWKRPKELFEFLGTRKEAALTNPVGGNSQSLNTHRPPCGVVGDGAGRGTLETSGQARNKPQSGCAGAVSASLPLANWPGCLHA